MPKSLDFIATKRSRANQQGRMKQIASPGWPNWEGVGSPSIDQEGIAYAEWSAQEWREDAVALAVARLPRAMLGGGS